MATKEDISYDDARKIKEAEQEKILLKDSKYEIEQKNKELQNYEQVLETRLENEIRKSKELEQEKILLKEDSESDKKISVAFHKKYYKVVAVFVIIIVCVVSAYSFYTVQLIGEQYSVKNMAPAPTGYVIQNLQGDTINTWLSWRLIAGTTLYVNVINAKEYPDKMKLINGVINDNASVQIDDSLLHKGQQGTTSTYYLGWKGALDSMEKTTQFYIPTKFDIIQSPQGVGDITIILTDDTSGDGYSGYTKSIADGTQNQILKSKITIYEVSKLNNNQFSTILRHEFGHALGLAHSTAPEDLMHATIQTDYPYISQCDIDAIGKLYDGGKSSEVVCKK